MKEVPQNRDIEKNYGVYAFLTPELRAKREELRSAVSDKFESDPVAGYEMSTKLAKKILAERPDARKYLLLHDIIGSSNVSDIVNGFDYEDEFIEKKLRDFLQSI